MKQIHGGAAAINGAIATAVIIAISLGIISLFENQFFSTWVSFAFMASIPTQIVCGLVWQTEYPATFATLSRPLKGLAYVSLSIMGACVFGPLMWYVVGGAEAPTPQLMMFTIFTVISTFWIVGVWQCWPLAAISGHPLFVGLGTLLLSYGFAYLLFNVLFNFEFLNGAPIYIEALDPHGMFMAWQALSFCVTTVAVIMFCILCDFWPVSQFKQAQDNSLIFGLGASAWVLLVSGAVFTVATQVLAIDYVVYMVRGPVSFIFGAFICLNMMQNALISNVVSQPLRGVVLACVCVVLAFAMQLLYEAASNVITPGLQSGMPAYELELWLANAMLAITFPIIVAHSDFFKLWPLAQLDVETESMESQKNG